MTYLYYDGSFEGFLCAVFEVYYLQLKRVAIQPQCQASDDLFANTMRVPTDEQRAKRVADRIIDIAGNDGLQRLWKAMLSELDGVENTLLHVIHYLLRKKRPIFSDYGNKHVLKLHQIMKKINRERHRMTAFVRFEEATDGVYYAIVEPDFNVLPLIINHFKNRYADQKWLIFDQSRSYGIYYDLQQVITVEPDQAENHSNNTPALSITLSDHEKEFQRLWQQYFQSTGIQSRKNTKLHLQHVPKRYWKHLTEKSI